MLYSFLLTKLLELAVLEGEDQRTVCACAFLPLSGYVISSPHPVLELTDQNHGKESEKSAHYARDTWLVLIV